MGKVYSVYLSTILGSLLISSCGGGACPSGERMGACGLKDVCVECFHSSQCPDQEKCSYDGICAVDVGWECETDIDCSGYPEVCIYNTCTIKCRGDFDCDYGEICRNETCITRKCQEDGHCPEGYEAVDGSLFCSYSPCEVEGQYSGACGLAYDCVECFHDSHCESGICTENGLCSTEECRVDADCEGEARCIDSRCEDTCLITEHCEFPAICNESTGTCHSQRCTEKGECGDWKYRPIEGSLLCEYNPCDTDETGLIVGVCGASNSCVECIDDTDCADGEFCDLIGMCNPYPQCGPDGYRNCYVYETCIDGYCMFACEDDLDCQLGDGICEPQGYCHFERCSRQGTCPEGWRPGTPASSPTSLWCVKNR